MSKDNPQEIMVVNMMKSQSKEKVRKKNNRQRKYRQSINYYKTYKDRKGRYMKKAEPILYSTNMFSDKKRRITTGAHWAPRCD